MPTVDEKSYLWQKLYSMYYIERMLVLWVIHKSGFENTSLPFWWSRGQNIQLFPSFVKSLLLYRVFTPAWAYLRATCDTVK